MKVKVPRFLIKDLVEHSLHNGVWNFQEYQSLFVDVKGAKAVGESTVLYLYYYEHAIKNIKHYLEAFRYYFKSYINVFCQKTYFNNSLVNYNFIFSKF